MAVVPGETVRACDDVVALRREVAQLQQALQSRGVIEQAKGMLMLRYDVDSDHAFAILRRLSQDRNVKLHTIADTLVHASSRRHDVTTAWDTALVRWLHEQLDMDEGAAAAREREHAEVLPLRTRPAPAVHAVDALRRVGPNGVWA